MPKTPNQTHPSRAAPPSTSNRRGTLPFEFNVSGTSVVFQANGGDEHRKTQIQELRARLMACDKMVSTVQQSGTGYNQRQVHSDTQETSPEIACSLESQTIIDFSTIEPK